MDESNHTAAIDGSSISYLLLRPIEVLQQIPVEYRWEFTRRHPYYLEFWKPAREFLEHPSADPAMQLAQQAASMIITAVNVSPSIPPPDPHDESATLGMDSVGTGWEGGAVAPAMIQTMAHTLLLTLPKAERAQLGRLLTESAEYELSDQQHMAGIHQRLAALPGEIWKSFPRAPIMSVNLQASQRAITEAVETLVRRWKQEQGISETRRRDDKLEEYLKVWDLREGWVGGAYDGSRERQLHEIAGELSVPLPTVANRYRAAFKYLTGHTYSPELWIRLFGPIKLSRLVDAEARSRLAQHRPWRSKNLRPVAESVLLPGRQEADPPQLLEAAGITPSDIGMLDLQLDIQTLIERGDTDEQITLELDPDGELPQGMLTDLMAALRARRNEAL